MKKFAITFYYIGFESETFFREAENKLDLMNKFAQEINEREHLVECIHRAEKIYIREYMPL